MRGHFNVRARLCPLLVSLVLQSQSEWRNKTRGFGLVPGGDEGQDWSWQQGSSGPKVYYTVRQEELQDRAMPS